MKSRVHPKYKTKYHVQNWASYDRALVSRGDITIWLSPEAVATWEPNGAGTRGAQRKYSDVAIETALTLECAKVLRFIAQNRLEVFLMADFGGILATLRKEEQQLAKQVAQVRSAIGALSGGSGAPIPLGKGKGRKKVAGKLTRPKLTAARKKAISARMKKYRAAKRKKSAK